MPLQVTQNCVLSGQGSPYDRDFKSYEAFRDALFKISENAPMFGRELLKQPNASDFLPHYDGVTNIAIG